MSEFPAANEARHTVDQVVTLLQCPIHRSEASRHAADYPRGLLADVERNNAWQLAKYASPHPRGIQRVLDRYAGDAEGVLDHLRGWLVAEFADSNGILVTDETGFPKQGRHAVGVARQYRGTPGQIATARSASSSAMLVRRATR